MTSIPFIPTTVPDQPATSINDIPDELVNHINSFLIRKDDSTAFYFASGCRSQRNEQRLADLMAPLLKSKHRKGLALAVLDRVRGSSDMHAHMLLTLFVYMAESDTDNGDFLFEWPDNDDWILSDSVIDDRSILQDCSKTLEKFLTILFSCNNKWTYYFMIRRISDIAASIRAVLGKSMNRVLPFLLLPPAVSTYSTCPQVCKKLLMFVILDESERVSTPKSSEFMTPLTRSLERMSKGSLLAPFKWGSDCFYVENDTLMGNTHDLLAAYFLDPKLHKAFDPEWFRDVVIHLPSHTN